MDLNNVVIISGCIIAIFIIGMIFKISMWKIIKLIINSILGGAFIYVINIFGTSFGLHIGLNIVTSIIVGILGVPGAFLLIILSKIL